MKKLLITTLVATLATITFAQSAAGLPGVKRRKDPEAFRQKVKEKTGGSVRKADSGKGWIKFVNAQKIVEESALKLPVQQLGAVTRFNVALVAGKAATMDEVPAAVKAADAQLGIVLLESDTLPTSLVAPDCGWAIINVKALAKDGKDADTVANRARKEMYRMFGYLCGSAYTLDPNCVMQPVNKLADLDNAGNLLSPQAFPRVTQYLKAQGIDPYIIKSYRDALKEGWAPKPADKYQQKLWDDFHAEPTGGLKIGVDKDGKTVVNEAKSGK